MNDDIVHDNADRHEGEKNECCLNNTPTNHGMRSAALAKLSLKPKTSEEHKIRTDLSTAGGDFFSNVLWWKPDPEPGAGATYSSRFPYSTHVPMCPAR